MKKLLSILLIASMLWGVCFSASADQLTKPLSEAVPFGVAHANNVNALAVYKSAAARSSADQLRDYQVCAILSTETVSKTLWYKIRYLSGKSLKEGYIKGDVFYPLTLAGLITISADAAAGETLRALISASNASAFVTATATPKPTATPSAARKATPKPTAAPATGRKRYVLNTKTMKFHLPGCAEVDRITTENRKNTTTTREALIEQGYDPCQKCNP